MQEMRRAVEAAMAVLLSGQPHGQPALLALAEPNNVMTGAALKALRAAADEARRLDHGYFSTGHLLIGLLRDDQGACARLLLDEGIDATFVRGRFAQLMGRGDCPRRTLVLVPKAAQALHLAVDEAALLGDTRLAPEHLLLGLMGPHEGLAALILASLGVDLVGLKGRITEATRRSMASRARRN